MRKEWNLATDVPCAEYGEVEEGCKSNRVCVERENDVCDIEDKDLQARFNSTRWTIE